MDVIISFFKYATPASVEEINNDNEQVFLTSSFPGSTKNSKPVKSLLGCQLVFACSTSTMEIPEQ